jgi:hypothetical protein
MDWSNRPTARTEVYPDTLPTNYLRKIYYMHTHRLRLLQSRHCHLLLLFHYRQSSLFLFLSDSSYSSFWLAWTTLQSLMRLAAFWISLQLLHFLLHSREEEKDKALKEIPACKLTKLPRLTVFLLGAHG